MCYQHIADMISVVYKPSTNRTCVENFISICKTLKRDPTELQSYLDIELNRNSIIHENNLILDGEFYFKRIKAVIKKCCRMYKCYYCYSYNTVFVNRYILHCNECQKRK